MNILYYGIQGSAPYPAVAWFFWGAAILAFIIGIIMCFSKYEPYYIIPTLAFVALFVAIGFLTNADSRTPIVKATINDEIGWNEINKGYTLIEQEGQIYTFEVKDVDIEEWVAQYGE